MTIRRFEIHSLKTREITTWLAQFRPRLRTCLFSPINPDQTEPLENSSRCPLGRWLAQAHLSHRETAELRSSHEALHAQARIVLQAVRKGEKAKASRLLEPDMPLMEALTKTRLALNSLQAEA